MCLGLFPLLEHQIAVSTGAIYGQACSSPRSWRRESPVLLRNLFPALCSHLLQNTLFYLAERCLKKPDSLASGGHAGSSGWLWLWSLCHPGLLPYFTLCDSGQTRRELSNAIGESGETSLYSGSETSSAKLHREGTFFCSFPVLRVWGQWERPFSKSCFSGPQKQTPGVP